MTQPAAPVSNSTIAPTDRAKRLALIALFAGAVAISLAPIWVRLSDAGPTATAFHRMALALPLLLVWMWAEQRGKQSKAEQAPRAPTRRDHLFVWLAGLAFAADLAVWHLSVMHTSVANATLLSNLMPLFLATFGYLFLGERYSRRFLTGMAVAMAGAAILMGGSFQLNPDQLVGDALGIATAVFYSSYVLCVKRARQALPTGYIMAMSAAISALILLPLAWGLAERLLPVSLLGWFAVFGLAWFTHAGGQGLIAYALAHLPAAFSSVGLLVQPVGAAIFAWLILGEDLTIWKLAGGAVVLAGIVLARKGS